MCKPIRQMSNTEMNLPTSQIPNVHGSNCLRHLLYSLIYASLSVLLVTLGVVWCSTSGAHQSSLFPANLKNNRQSTDSELSGSANTRIPTISRVEAEPIRRSYLTSSGTGDYGESSNLGSSTYGNGQVDYQQPQLQQATQQSPDNARQFGSSYFPTAPEYEPYYPGYGLENRILSLFPRRNFFAAQSHFPFGSYGNSYYPNSYNYWQYGNYPGGNMGAAYGPFGRPGQPSLLGSLQSYKDRLIANNQAETNQ